MIYFGEEVIIQKIFILNSAFLTVWYDFIKSAYDIVTPLFCITTAIQLIELAKRVLSLSASK